MLSLSADFTESDVDLAVASNAIIIGFNTVPDAGARDLAEKEKQAHMKKGWWNTCVKQGDK